MNDLGALSEEELIGLAQQGVIEAFSRLYERFLPVVYNRVRYIVPAVDVEDVTQEVFIALLRSLEGFRGQSQFTTWLRTLTNRRVADYYRRRYRGEQGAVDADLSDIAPATDGNLRLPSYTAVADDEMILRQALQALPEHYREVLLLRFAEDMKFQEIARNQGQSLEATKSLFRRAVAALRHELGEMNVTSG
jgi:RNA polymerase sigma-70 factor, ECF subfamily